MNAYVDISNTVLETERLLLRPWKPEDLADLYEYASVDGVGQMAGWPPHTNLEISRRILEQFIAEKKTFALEEKATGKVIGSLGLENGERHDVGDLFDQMIGREIGYVLSRDYWGKGLMPEAVTRVIRYVLDELDWDYVLCGHFIENNQSRKVIEKCGFQYLTDTRFETVWGEIKEGKLYWIKR